MGDSMRDQVIRRISQDVTTTAEGAAAYRAWVEEEAASGNPSAILWEEQARAEGFRRHYVATMKRLGGGYVIAAAGIRRSIGQMFGLAERDDNGMKTGAFQLGFWMEYGWDEIKELISAQERHRTTLAFNLYGLRKALRLLDLCPDARSPADACRRLGLDAEQYFAS